MERLAEWRFLVDPERLRTRRLQAHGDLFVAAPACGSTRTVCRRCLRHSALRRACRPAGAEDLCSTEYDLTRRPGYGDRFSQRAVGLPGECVACNRYEGAGIRVAG